MSKLIGILFSVFMLLAVSSAVSAQQAAVVDVPMLSRGVMPAVEVMVNGKGPFLFAIDTGASGKARIDASLAEKLSLSAVGEAMGGDGSGRNPQSMKLVHVDSISIGSLTFKDIDAPSRDYNLRPDLQKIDGILGFDLFSEYLLTLDYPGKRVRVEKGELPANGDKTVLSYESLHGIPIIELNVGGTKMKAHLDSGNTVGGFILPTALAEKQEFLSAPVSVGKARTVSNEIEIKEAKMKGSIRLGNHEFKDPTITYPAVSDAVNIGSKVLRDFAITFDQKNKRVRFNWIEPKG